jgi:hypothetical protein
MRFIHRTGTPVTVYIPPTGVPDADATSRCTPSGMGAARLGFTGAVITRSLLAAHDVNIVGDSPWQRRARLHQSLWRQRYGLATGAHRGSPLGSRLSVADAEPPALANYLSPAAKRQVQQAVAAAPTTGALLSRPRLWVDLLSSQPLCFNLFGPLAEDLDLATTALHKIWPDIRTVTDIRFEWSPGRGDQRYTGNRSAFDVFIEYVGDRGRSFLGIEVKYHEDLTGTAASDPAGRYPAIARKHQVFRNDAIPQLQELPLQQLWLDHLLALQLRACRDDGWDTGTFVLLYPLGNTACAAAAQRYRRTLADADTFDVRTLDDVVGAIRLSTPDQWPVEVYERYLDPTLVNDALAGGIQT